MSKPDVQHINCPCDTEPVCCTPDGTVCMREFGHNGPHVLCGMPALSGSTSTEESSR